MKLQSVVLLMSMLSCKSIEKPQTNVQTSKVSNQLYWQQDNSLLSKLTNKNELRILVVGADKYHNFDQATADARLEYPAHFAGNGKEIIKYWIAESLLRWTAPIRVFDNASINVVRKISIIEGTGIETNGFDLVVNINKKSENIPAHFDCYRKAEKDYDLCLSQSYYDTTQNIVHFRLGGTPRQMRQMLAHEIGHVFGVDHEYMENGLITHNVLDREKVNIEKRFNILGLRETFSMTKNFCVVNESICDGKRFDLEKKYYESFVASEFQIVDFKDLLDAISKASKSAPSDKNVLQIRDLATQLKMQYAESVQSNLRTDWLSHFSQMMPFKLVYQLDGMKDHQLTAFVSCMKGKDNQLFDVCLLK